MNSNVLPPAANNSAAQLLGYSVKHFFGDVTLLGGGLHSLGFYYDFLLPQRMPDSALAILEAELMTLVKSEVPIELRSMMRENAHALLMHQGYDHLASLVLQCKENIVTLLQIEDFYGPVEEPAATTTEEVGAIKLLRLEQHEAEDGIRVHLVGAACPNPQILKRFVKTYQQLSKKEGHLILGEQLALFDSDGFWYSRGVRLRDLFRKWWLRTEKALLPYETVETLHDLLLDPELLLAKHKLLFSKRRGERSLPLRQHEYAHVKQQVREAEGLLLAEDFHEDYTFTLCLEDQVRGELISSLQFIEQNITILCLKGRWIHLKGRKRHNLPSLEYDITPEERTAWASGYEFRLVDALGREWPGPAITLHEGLSPGERIIARSSGSIERILALLLEQCEGNLPLYLAPEQVRILTIGSSGDGWAKKVEEFLTSRQIRVGFDARSVKLGEKVHAAENEKVPFLAMIGEQEARDGVLAVRTAKSPQQSQKMGLEDFAAYMVAML